MPLLIGLVWVVAEIATFVVVADHIGVLLAVILVLGISSAGPFLVKRAGIGVIEHARQRLRRGEAPTREALDGVLLLVAGLLVCIPGFLGDAVGLLLLLGPVRHAVYRVAGRWLARRVAVGTFGAPPSAGAGRFGFGAGRGGAVVDAASHEEASPPARPPAPPETALPPATPRPPEAGGEGPSA